MEWARMTTVLRFASAKPSGGEAGGLHIVKEEPFFIFA